MSLSPAKLQAWSGAVLQVVEGLALGSVAIWALFGAIHYGWETGFSFRAVEPYAPTPTGMTFTGSFRS